MHSERKRSVLLRPLSVALFLLEATSGGENPGIPTTFLSLPFQQEHNSYFGQPSLGGESCPTLPTLVWEAIRAISFSLFPFLFLSVLLARVYLLFTDTGLALDVAAPAHLAVAGHCDEVQRCVVATSAAKAAAARVLGAGASGRPGRVQRRAAEAGRLF